MISMQLCWLAPCQLGYGISGGMEAAVRAARDRGRRRQAFAVANAVCYSDVDRFFRPAVWRPDAAVGRGGPARGLSGPPSLLPGHHRTAGDNEFEISPGVP